jgi:uncharacterized protein (TIGR03435 family)
VTYDLVVAKNGPKLQEGSLKDASGQCRGGYLRTSIEATSCSMPWLTHLLTQFIFETEIFDKTGLSVVYDFKFEFASIGPAAPPDSDSSTSPSLFTAIQSLGLKLEARKAPIKFPIVDQVEKLSEN